MPISIARRVDLIRNLGLRGAMIWEISQDSDGYELSRLVGQLLRD